MKELERIKVLEDELALLKADLVEREKKKQPITIKGTLDFLVHPTEFEKMSWGKAYLACASLGEGWRLPNRLELLLMYEHKDVVGGFGNKNFYWSSTESDSGDVWIQSFGFGIQLSCNKNTTNYVRAVKTI